MFKKKDSDVFLENAGPSVAFAFFLCLFVLFNLIKGRVSTRHRNHRQKCRSDALWDAQLAVLRWQQVLNFKHILFPAALEPVLGQGVAAEDSGSRGLLRIWAEDG